MGLCLDLLGALVLAAPDLPGLKQRLTPEQLEEARSQFMELGHLSENDPRQEDIVSVVHQNVEWLDVSPPDSLSITIRPGGPRRCMSSMKKTG